MGVPRGLLRFLVLEMLSRRPMAGAEIAEEIEIQTKGHWKPSPGSIYPLMSWMTKKGFTKELPKNQKGFKRYSYTPSGRRFFKEQSFADSDIGAWVHELSKTGDGNV